MRSLLLTAVVLGLVTGIASAQDGCLEQVKFPEVGRWAQYKALYNNEPYTMRYSVIGSEERGGKDLLWLEIEMAGVDKAKTMVYQVLTPGSLSEVNQAEEVVVKMGSQPAMKMSGQMLEMLRGQLDKQSFLKDICDGVSLVGKESVSVPAGKFPTLHFRSTEDSVDSWISAEVPFSVVKSAGKRFELELAGHGQGAKSSITEQPQEMGGMGGPAN